MVYTDVDISKSEVIRTFSENIDEIELKWHRDQEDRIIESLSKSDWKIQLENQLPVFINSPVHIKSGEWHRLIKGKNELTLKIIKNIEKD
jgi:hypothetical protein